MSNGMNSTAWKRGEMKLHCHGYYDLAKAVMKQWSQDGRPRCDEAGVKIWKAVLESHHAHMCKAVKSGSLL